jgi:ATP-dependent RNA helicase DDX1
VWRDRYGGGRKFTGKVEKGKENPFSCVVLHGGRQHAERKRNLAAFKEGDVRFLVCTDVAARGLDIAGLPYCINMTLPDKPEDYIHRIGRVGRADTMGLAISLVATEKEKVRTCSGEYICNASDIQTGWSPRSERPFER